MLVFFDVDQPNGILDQLSGDATTSDTYDEPKCRKLICSCPGHAFPIRSLLCDDSLSQSRDVSVGVHAAHAFAVWGARPEFHDAVELAATCGLLNFTMVHRSRMPSIHGPARLPLRRNLTAPLYVILRGRRCRRRMKNSRALNAGAAMVWFQGGLQFGPIMTILTM